MSKEKIYDDKYYEPTPEDQCYLANRFSKVLEIFSKYRFDRILDVGCGDGNFSIRLKKECGADEVFGIELSKKGVELANEKGVRAIQMDIDSSNFPFEDNYFDAVFAGEVIEHLYNPDHLLEEIHRVLKSDGFCVITTPNLASWMNRISLLFGFQPYATNVSLRHSVGHLYEPQKEHKMGEADHKKIFTYRSLVMLLTIYNFIILKTIGAHVNTSSNKSLSRLANALDKVFSFFPSLAHSVIIVCKAKKLRNY
jgi:methionine biosynthesis protein MetW